MVSLGRVELPTNGLGSLKEDNRRDVESPRHLWDCAQNYYEFTTVVRFEAFRPERPNRRNLLKLKKVRMVPAGGIEPTA